MKAKRGCVFLYAMRKLHYIWCMQHVNYIIMYLGDLRFHEVCVIGEENVVCMFSFWLSLSYVMLSVAHQG